MQSLQHLSTPETRTLLICVSDISNFTQLAKSFPPKEPDKLFGFMDELAQIISQRVAEADGVVIKYIGDSALIAFDDRDVDAAVMAMYHLKSELEACLADKGFRNTVTFSLHIGETAIGYMGKEPFRWLDVIGDTVQLTFAMLNRMYKRRFTITPQVFRKLKPETRKTFHKYTPPIVYLAE
jgi:class 3 adenylate cyclase